MRTWVKIYTKGTMLREVDVSETPKSRVKESPLVLWYTCQEHADCSLVALHFGRILKYYWSNGRAVIGRD
jgi:hypothetical protein